MAEEFDLVLPVENIDSLIKQFIECAELNKEMAKISVEDREKSACHGRMCAFQFVVVELKRALWHAKKKEDDGTFPLCPKPILQEVTNG